MNSEPMRMEVMLLPLGINIDEAPKRKTSRLVIAYNQAWGTRRSHPRCDPYGKSNAVSKVNRWTGCQSYVIVCATVISTLQHSASLKPSDPHNQSMFR
jgi:hypothetical protein